MEIQIKLVATGLRPKFGRVEPAKVSDDTFADLRASGADIALLEVWVALGVEGHYSRIERRGLFAPGLPPLGDGVVGDVYTFTLPDLPEGWRIECGGYYVANSDTGDNYGATDSDRWEERRSPAERAAIMAGFALSGEPMVVRF